MSFDGRLNKLMPVLSAKERAVLILDSWKKGEKEDPLWRRSMPSDQSSEFNRLIHLMNGSVLNLGGYINILELQLEKLELRQCWFVAIKLWEENLTEIDRAARVAVREPITESEYSAKQKEIDEEWVPVAELAGVLAEDYEGWKEDELETLEGWDGPVVTDAAWERVCGEKERELRRLVAAKALRGKGRGADLCVQEGVFNAHFGRTSSPVPEDNLSYRVLPDSEAEAVSIERAQVQRLGVAIDRRRLVVDDETEQRGTLDILKSLLRTSLGAAYAALWGAVEATEKVLGEVAVEFEGSDPIKLPKREALDALKAKLAGFGEQLIFLDVEFEMPELDEELVESLRKAARIG